MSEPQETSWPALDSDSAQVAGARGVRHAAHVAAGQGAGRRRTVMTWPEALFRAAVAIEVLAIVLVLLSLFWDAPLEELADPMQTPNPGEGAVVLPGLAGDCCTTFRRWLRAC